MLEMDDIWWMNAIEEVLLFQVCDLDEEAETIDI
jgi:hypothetical protein